MLEYGLASTAHQSFQPRWRLFFICALPDSSHKLQVAHATQELHVNLNFIYIYIATVASAHRVGHIPTKLVPHAMFPCTTSWSG